MSVAPLLLLLSLVALGKQQFEVGGGFAGVLGVWGVVLLALQEYFQSTHDPTSAVFVVRQFVDLGEVGDGAVCYVQSLLLLLLPVDYLIHPLLVGFQELGVLG